MQIKISISKLYLYIVLALLGLILIVSLLSCNDTEASIDSSPEVFQTSINYTQPVIAAAMMTPCDSIYYVPVAYGAELRILKNTLSKGNRKGINWWQAKSFAWQLIDPTKYQQDSTRERVVFADRDTITYSDTFYICRKKRL